MEKKKKKKEEEERKGLNNINKNRIITNENTYLPVIPQLLLLVAFGPLWVTPWICFLLCQCQSASRWLFSWVQLQGVCPWSPHAAGLLQWTLHVHVILWNPLRTSCFMLTFCVRQRDQTVPTTMFVLLKLPIFFGKKSFDGPSLFCLMGIPLCVRAGKLLLHARNLTRVNVWVEAAKSENNYLGSCMPVYVWVRHFYYCMYIYMYTSCSFHSDSSLITG